MRSIGGEPPNEVGVNRMDDDMSAIGSASTHTQVALEVPIPVREPVCNRTDHQWEECNTRAYCIGRGCLRFGKKCYSCKKTFRPGRPEPGELAEECYYPTTRNPVHHCALCKLAFCHPCRVQWNLGSPRRTPTPIARW